LKSFVKVLSLWGFSLGGDIVRVDVENNDRIIRTRPLHYDWKYMPEEVPVWQIENRGKIFKHLMKELPPPFRLAYKLRVYSNRVRYLLKRVDRDPKGEKHTELSHVCFSLWVAVLSKLGTQTAGRVGGVQSTYGAWEPVGLSDSSNALHDILENTEVLLCWGCDYGSKTWGRGSRLQPLGLLVQGS